MVEVAAAAGETETEAALGSMWSFLSVLVWMLLFVDRFWCGSYLFIYLFIIQYWDIFLPRILGVMRRFY